MTTDRQTLGWDWFGAAEAPPAFDDRELCKSVARCLSSEDGARLLAHLKSSMLERRLGPASSDAELRHAEGQRFAVAHIFALYERGRAG